MKRAFCIIFSVLYFGNVFPDDREQIDSLRHAIESAVADSLKADLLFSMADLYANADPDSAIIIFGQSLYLAEKINSVSRQARISRLIAYIYFIKSDFDNSIRYGLQALRLAENTGSDKLIMQAGNTLALAYNSHGDYDKALELYINAMNGAVRLRDSTALSTIYNNMANVFFYQGLFDKSLDYHQRSLEIRTKLGNKGAVADCLNDIGVVYSKQGNFQNAMEFYTRCLALKEEINDREGISFSLANLASTYVELGNPLKALELLPRCEKLCLDDGYYSILAECYEYFSLAYSKLGDFKKAYGYYLRYGSAKDSILNETSNRQIAEMQTKYETEKKEVQIKGLEKDNRIRQLEIEKKDADIGKQKWLLRSAAGGASAMLIIAFFIYRGYVQKKRSNIQLRSAYRTIEEKNTLVQEKNREITDSIHYARRIQRALLASDKLLQKQLQDYFILYKPKDIVSGDFYWAGLIPGSSPPEGSKFLLCTADCTGHGVPGAFMSLLGISFLNEITLWKKISNPELILDRLRGNIIKTLNPEGTKEEARDGMDCVLCSYDFYRMELKFACANNPLWLVRGKELIEFKPDKFPVGKYFDNALRPFTLHEIKLQKGDIIYTFSDGLADQFGGPGGKKFKQQQLRELLLQIHALPVPEQKNILESRINTWKGGLEQVDDMLLVGVKI